MTWVAWRQHRAVLIGALTFVFLAAGWFAWLRLRIDAAVEDLGMTSCVRQDSYSCPLLLQERLSQSVSTLTGWSGSVLLGVPVLVGILVGVTVFARDYEQRTHLFSLTQTVSRPRWWATKTAVLAVPLTLAMGGLGLLVSWTWAPVRMIQNPRLWTPYFQAEGIVLGAWFLLAFAVAAGLGLVLRSVITTIVAGLVVYAAVFGGFALLHPHLLPADQLTAAAGDDDGSSTLQTQTPGDAWVLSHTYHDGDGNQVTLDLTECEEGQFISACYLDQGAVEERMTIQPPSRFWPLQLLESVLLAALSAAALILGLASLLRRAL